MQWFNSQYISSYSVEIFWNKLQTYLTRYDTEFLSLLQSQEETFLFKIFSELQSRIKILSEVKSLTNYFFEEISEYKPEIMLNPKMKIETSQDAKESLLFAQKVLEKISESANLEEIKNIFIEEIGKSGMKNGQVLWPVRVALSMQQFSP